MLAALNADADSAPQETIENVWRGIHAFIAGEEQFDDITMLCFTYKGISQ